MIIVLQFWWQKWLSEWAVKWNEAKFRNKLQIDKDVSQIFAYEMEKEVETVIGRYESIGRLRRAGIRNLNGTFNCFRKEKHNHKLWTWWACVHAIEIQQNLQTITAVTSKRCLHSCGNKDSKVWSFATVASIAINFQRTCMNPSLSEERKLIAWKVVLRVLSVTVIILRFIWRPVWRRYEMHLKKNSNALFPWCT